jgi:Zn-finger nucleic acid-binding protein
MIRCPACSQSNLTQIRAQHGLFNACKSCGGVLVALSLLQKVSDPKLLGEVWRTALARGIATGRLCPTCPAALLHAVIPRPEKNTEIDLCRECMTFWFDRGELEAIPKASDAEIAERSGPKLPKPQTPAPLGASIDPWELRYPDEEPDSVFWTALLFRLF